MIAMMMNAKESSRQETWSRHGLIAMGVLLMTFAFPAAATATLPAAARAAILNGEWAGVLETLEKSDIKDADAVCRMVAAHACLAENRNNQALILFSAAENGDGEAWKAWTAALSKENPNNAVAHYLHGDALARSRDLKGAEACFTQALERDPKMGLDWVARGVVRALTGRTDDAYMDLLRATQVQPTLADAHASLGCLEVMLQNAEGALEAFNEALKLDPAFALALKQARPEVISGAAIHARPAVYTTPFFVYTSHIRADR
jgi:tetratricopeptide (TPR) repeat protein